MRCEEAGRLISAGMDGELEGTIGAELHTHLEECAACSIEQQALAATVRLLRAVPEVEPPAALRRQIRCALQEIERRSQPRSLGLGWLIRSHAPGWTWGAAAGAAAGAALLVLTRGHAPAPRLARAPAPSPTQVATLSHPAPPPPEVRTTPKRYALSVRKPSPKLEPTVSLPHLTVELPPPAAPTAEAPPELPHVTPTAPVIHPRRIHARAVHRFTAVAHRYGPVAAPLLLNSHPSPPRSASATPSDPSGDTQGHTVPHSRPLYPTDDLAAMPSEPDVPTDTSGMTQMASGNTMPTAPAPDDDDLAELRRRLSDRPLQIPELGEPRPANRPGRSHGDGWIRF